VINETVLAVKKFLDKKLARYEHLSRASKSISSLFDNEGNFQQVKQKEVRQITLKDCFKYTI